MCFTGQKRGDRLTELVEMYEPLARLTDRRQRGSCVHFQKKEQKNTVAIIYSLLVACKLNAEWRGARDVATCSTRKDQ